MRKFQRPSEEEVTKVMILRFCQQAGKIYAFSPLQVLSMREYVIAGIMDLTDDGVQSVLAEARYLERIERRNDNKMTLAQKLMLEQLSKLNKPYTPNESNFGERTRVLKNLLKLGYVSEYVHGGYEITESGRIATTESKDEKPIAAMMDI